MNIEKRRAIFTLLKQNTPNPTTELVYQSPFELLISVILSAQTTDIAVNKVTKKLFSIANTPLLKLNTSVVTTGVIAALIAWSLAKAGRSG